MSSGCLSTYRAFHLSLFKIFSAVWRWNSRSSSSLILSAISGLVPCSVQLHACSDWFVIFLLNNRPLSYIIFISNGIWTDSPWSRLHGFTYRYTISRNFLKRNDVKFKLFFLKPIVNKKRKLKAVLFYTLYPQMLLVLRLILCHAMLLRCSVGKRMTRGRQLNLWNLRGIAFLIV